MRAVSGLNAQTSNYLVISHAVLWPLRQDEGADLDDLALPDEQRHLDDMPRLQGRCLGAPCAVTEYD